MTVPAIVPDGARWRRVDLHLHSPGVHSFKLEQGDDPSTDGGRALLVRRFVKALVDSGVEIAALTDYQGPREPWFSEIRQLASAAGIEILPGAEWSINQGGGAGLHLLLICNPGITSAQIIEALRHQDEAGTALVLPDRQEHRDSDLREPLAKAIAAVRRNLSCVVVAPHADTKNGLVKSLNPKTAAEFVSDELIDAFDNCPRIKISLQGTGVLTTSTLETLANTESSDAKSFAAVAAGGEAGAPARRTWLKLSRVDAPSIRLALHDPLSRVLTREPEPPHHARLRSIEVEGGFLSGLRINFSDDLTCLIGGRGAGKSAVLETIRYGLDVRPYVDQSERLALVRHALGSGGVVRLVVERSGPQPQRYEVTRVLDQLPRVRDLASGTDLEISPVEVFGDAPPVILLQREIQAVARDGDFRRRLLDELVGEQARTADREVGALLERVRANARQLEDVERRLGEREERAARLRRLDADVAYYEQQGVADKLTRHSRLGADGTRVARAESATRSAGDSLVGVRHAVGESMADAAMALGAAESEHAAELSELARVYREVAAVIDQYLAQALAAANTARAEARALAASWPDRLAALDEDLRRVQEQLRTSRLDPAIYLEAVRERTALQPLVADLARQDAVREQLLETRAAITRDLQEARRRAYTLRDEAARLVSQQMKGRLRVEVTYLGDRDGFREGLGALLKGSRVTGEAVATVATAGGIDGVELARLVREGAGGTAARLQLSEANAERLVSWFISEPSRLRMLETMAPLDGISVALVVDGGSKSLDQLSGGQRATAVLLLLFAQGQRPLLLDQPEDDLDNRFIYDDVVALIRQEKGVIDPHQRRQIIAATHNANIPVNGDAELVVSLEEADGQVRVRARSSIDDTDVRQEIRAVLEGGEEAFRRRAEKYGGVDR